MLKTHIRPAMLAAAGTLLALALPAAAAGSVAPLPSSAYLTRHVCPAPEPGRASCLALELTPTIGAGSTAARLPAVGALREDKPFELPLSARPAPPLRTRAAPSYADGQIPEPIFPAGLRSAYRLPLEPVSGSATQTIALVDAYNDPNAESDLAVYSKASSINLAECSHANGCFSKVNQNGVSAEEGAGGTPFPKSAKELQEREATCESGNPAACAEAEEAVGWTVEISTDVDVAHSLCQSCHILLVEANSPSFADLEKAEETAEQLGATEVSNSWGGSEPLFESPAFNDPKTVITAAAGDDGYLNWTQAEEAKASREEYYEGADYPASSPHVVAVGGTELTLTGAGARKSETVWNEDPDPEGGNEGAGGGGCSTELSAPEWQRKVPDWAQVGCGTGRAVADIAADADPYSGVLVYDSEEYTEDFIVIGGTSVASPIVASTFALAGGAHGVDYPAQTLYSRLGSPPGFPSLYDVTEGGNGKCDGAYLAGCSGSMAPLSSFDCGKGKLICNAGPGYDGPTGVGTPNGVTAFEPESEAEHTQRVTAEANAAAEQKAAEELHAEEVKQAAEKQKSEEAARQSLEEKQRAEAARRLGEEAQAAEVRRLEAEIGAAERKIAEELALANSKGGAGGTSQSGTSSGSSTGKKATGSPAPKGSHHSRHHHKRRRKHRHRRTSRHRR